MRHSLFYRLFDIAPVFKLNKPIQYLSYRIGFDLNSLLHRPGLVESASRSHMLSEWPMAIVGL